MSVFRVSARWAGLSFPKHAQTLIAVIPALPDRRDKDVSDDDKGGRETQKYSNFPSSLIFFYIPYSSII